MSGSMATTRPWHDHSHTFERARRPHARRRGVARYERAARIGIDFRNHHWALCSAGGREGLRARTHQGRALVAPQLGRLAGAHRGCVVCVSRLRRVRCAMPVVSSQGPEPEPESVRLCPVRARDARWRSARRRRCGDGCGGRRWPQARPTSAAFHLCFALVLNSFPSFPTLVNPAHADTPLHRDREFPVSSTPQPRRTAIACRAHPPPPP